MLALKCQCDDRAPRWESQSQAATSSTTAQQGEAHDGNALGVVLLVAPLVVAALIAAFNLDASNSATEPIEAWLRARQRLTAAKPGSFQRYVVHPPPWAIVKGCDWTDGFSHRGLKSGTRVAFTLYLVGVWLFVLYVTAHRGRRCRDGADALRCPQDPGCDVRHR